MINFREKNKEISAAHFFKTLFCSSIFSLKFITILKIDSLHL